MKASSSRASISRPSARSESEWPVLDGPLVPPDAARPRLSDEEILELSYVVAMYAMHATLSRALRLEYDDVDERVVEIPAPSGETGLERTLQTPPGE